MYTGVTNKAVTLFVCVMFTFSPRSSQIRFTETQYPIQKYFFLLNAVQI